MCCGGVKRLSRQKRILLTDILVKIPDTLSGRKPSLQAAAGLKIAVASLSLGLGSRIPRLDIIAP